MTRRRRFAAAAAIAAVLACDPYVSTPRFDTNLAPVLRDLGRVVVVPTYFYVDAAARALAAQLRALELDVSAPRLVAAQVAWRQARERWMESRVLLFGPPEDQGFDAAIDFTPASPTRIAAALAQGVATSAAVDPLGANQKGFLALEQLLFDPAGGNEAVLAQLGGEAGAPRRAFARALAENLAKKTGQLHDLWAAGGLAGELEQAGQGSSVFPSQTGALALVINRIAFMLETAADQWLGRPLGRRAGGVVVPDEEVARRSDQSIVDLVRVIDGVRQVVRCRTPEGFGVSLYGLLSLRGDTLAERLRAAVDAATDALLAVPPPLRTALLNARHIVEGARNRIIDLYRLLATEVSGALGVVLTFTPNDGD